MANGNAATAASGSQEATQGGDITAESYVTPELEAKFAEVFDGDGGTASEPRDAASAATPPSQVKRRPRVVQALADEEEEAPPTQQQDGGIPKPPDEQASLVNPKSQPRQPAVRSQDAPEEPAATLNPLLRQAAKRAGWTDEDVDELVALDPEKAEKTFRRMHSSLNELSARFAAFGQQQQPGGSVQQQLPPGWVPPQQQQQQHPAQQQQQPLQGGMAPEAILTGLFGPDFKERFTDRYGQHFAADVLQPLVQQVLLPVQQMQQYLHMQEQQQLAHEVQGFFRESAKDFGDLVGPAQGKLTPEQDDLRYRVCATCDQIRAGAAMQGRPMSMREGLDAAFHLVAGEFLQQTERRKLTEQVRQRSGRITAPPTQRHRSTPRSRGERSDEAALEAATAKMAEIGLLDDGA